MELRACLRLFIGHKLQNSITLCKRIDSGNIAQIMLKTAKAPDHLSVFMANGIDQIDASGHKQNK